MNFEDHRFWRISIKVRPTKSLICCICKYRVEGKFNRYLTFTTLCAPFIFWFCTNCASGTNKKKACLKTNSYEKEQ